YEKTQARTWARQHLVGCSSVTTPTFASDLRRLNEAAIAHDVALGVEHGFPYTLLMAETNITPHENARFTAVAREAAAGRRRLICRAACGPREATVGAARRAEGGRGGAPVLPSPPQFWPTSEQEVYEYTRAFCEATSLGVILFPIPLWGFERIHPAGMSVE